MRGKNVRAPISPVVGRMTWRLSKEVIDRKMARVGSTVCCLQKDYARQQFIKKGEVKNVCDV